METTAIAALLAAADHATEPGETWTGLAYMHTLAPEDTPDGLDSQELYLQVREVDGGTYWVTPHGDESFTNLQVQLMHDTAINQGN